jgi:endonuclease-3
MARILRILDELQRFYGNLPAPPRDPFALFVWEVMSVHTSPRKRDAAMGALKQKRILTPDSMWTAPQKTLQESVAAAGPYSEQRLRSLRTGAGAFRKSPDLPKIIKGPLPAARKVLKGIPQMGEGGAYRMLLFAADHAVLPVDARVSRVAVRLGFGTLQSNFTKTARSIREAVASELPRDADSYRVAYLYLTHHGNSTCTQADPHCRVCPVSSECDEGKARLSRQGGQS